MTITIDEEGFLYGAWDNQNNIWLYGENTGIQEFLMDDVDHFTKKEEIDLKELPFPLQKVVEHYSEP